MNRKSTNISRRNCQNRSFQNQDLTAADFHQTDLRGCDFSYTNLANADFTQARLGRSPRQWFQLISLVIASVLLTGNGVWRLIFLGLGQPLVGTSGGLILGLHGLLLLLGLLSLGLTRSPRLSLQITGGLCGALLGFFYAGKAFDQSIVAAAIGAVAVAVAIVWGLRQSRSWLQLVTIAAGMTATSATVFLLSVPTLAGWFGQSPAARLTALGGSLICLVYLWLTWCWSGALHQHIRRSGGTSFHAAQLTGADFTEAELGLVHWPQGWLP